MDSCVNCHQTHEQGVKVATLHRLPPDVKTVDGHRERSAGRTRRATTTATARKRASASSWRACARQTLAAIYSYAKDVVKAPIVYDGATYPYWFADKDGDGKPDKDAKGAAVAFTNWTPRLLQAAYNYQYMTKDPGAEAHNGKYAIQVLYDTLESLGQGGAQVQMTGKVRP